MNADESSRLRRSGRLPFTAFETYLYGEDRVSYPCWMIVKGEFSGRLDHKAFLWAWDEVGRLHPLSRARVETDGRGHHSWRLQQDEPLEVRFLNHPRDGFTPVFPPLDPVRDNAIRIWVVEDNSGFDVYFQAYHVAFDGLGGLQILYDSLVLYEVAMGREIPVPERDVDALADRNRFLKGFWPRLRAAPQVVRGLLLGFLVQRHRGKPLLPHQPPADDEAPPQPWPQVIHGLLPPETFGQLRRASRDGGATINDLLLRDFQLAVGDWRRAHGYGVEEDWIRVAVPINLRGASHRKGSAANMVSLITIDRQMRSLRPERRERLLFRICEDMNRIRRAGLDRLYLWMLSAYRWLPGGIEARSRRNRCDATAIFSYLGRVFSVGPLVNGDRKLEVSGAVLEDLWLIGPLRPQSLVCIESFVYGSLLHFDLHYDPRFLSRELAEDLFNRIVANIKLSAGCGSPGTAK